MNSGDLSRFRLAMPPVRRKRSGRSRPYELRGQPPVRWITGGGTSRKSDGPVRRGGVSARLIAKREISLASPVRDLTIEGISEGRELFVTIVEI